MLHRSELLWFVPVAVDNGPKGYGYRLRAVEAQDAASIFVLRTDPELGRYLNPTSGRVEDQERWIELQRARPCDYYFAIETLEGRWEGVVGLYGVATGSAEWGRWLLRRGSLAAPASILLILEFAFGHVGLERVFCRTLAANTPVVGFHDACRYSSRTSYVDTNARDFVEHGLDDSDWPSFREALVPVAERVARRRVAQ